MKLLRLTFLYQLCALVSAIRSDLSSNTNGTSIRLSNNDRSIDNARNTAHKRCNFRVTSDKHRIARRGLNDHAAYYRVSFARRASAFQFSETRSISSRYTPGDSQHRYLIQRGKEEGGGELLAGKITARKPERVGRALGPGLKKNAISFRTLE